MNQQKTSTRNTFPRANNSHANFIEALKASGSNIANSTFNTLKNDVIGATAKNLFDNVTGNSSQKIDTNNSPDNIDFDEYLRSHDQQVRGQEYVKHTYEYQESVIFNRRQEVINSKISQIQHEIKKLAAEIVNLDQSIQTVAFQEISKPGEYHLNLLEKILKSLRDIRKRVIESRHWAALQNQRSQHKSYFWQQANQKVSGTKFLLSHERTVATQSG